MHQKEASSPYKDADKMTCLFSACGFLNRAVREKGLDDWMFYDARTPLGSVGSGYTA